MKTTLSIADLRKTARLTGALYFILAVLGIFSFLYAGPLLYVSGDATATAHKMLANESLLRIDIAIGAISNVMFIVIALLLYQMLGHINEYQAKLMVYLVLVSVPVAFSGHALELTALEMFKGKLLSTFQLDQAHSLAMSFLKIARISGQLLTVYWGLWLMPLGLLVFRSGFIPKIFGVLLLINGLGYLVQCFTFILLPGSLQPLMKFIFPIYFAGEIPFIFWLLIKGVRDHSNTL